METSCRRFPRVGSGHGGRSSALPRPSPRWAQSWPSGSSAQEAHPLASPAAAEAPGDRSGSTAKHTPATTPSDPVRIAFVGDIHFQSGVAPAQVLAPGRPLYAGADLVIANLETAIGTGGSRATKEFVFRAPPSVFAALTAAGIGAVSMANNHALDYGSGGIASTLAAARDAKLHVVGLGADRAGAFRPAILEVRGRRVAVIAATDVLDDPLRAAWTATELHAGMASAKEDDAVAVAVQNVRPQVDTVVVFLHWGVEGSSCPSARQEELARQLVAAGADVVVGSHAHRVQGGGRLGAAFVDFGLGNYAFHATTAGARTTGALVVDVAGRTVGHYEWRPGLIVRSSPRPLPPSATAAAVAAWNGLRRCTSLQP
jgi:hypothetical protein